MFNKLKNKFSSSRRNNDNYSTSELATSTLENPAVAINTPRNSVSEPGTPFEYRSRWASMSSMPDSMSTVPDAKVIAFAIDEDERKQRQMARSQSRGRSLSTGTAAMKSTSKSRSRRKRDIFWRNGLWDESSAAPYGSRVRASSQSVDMMHPEIAEERMRNVAGHRWRA